MITTIRIAAALTFLAILYVLVGNFDYADDLTAEAIAKEARGAAVTAATLSHPLPYTDTVTQYGDGIKQPRTRFYVPTSAK